MKEVNRVSDIPSFTSDEEAADFWATHSLGPELLAQMKTRKELAAELGYDPLPAPRPRREK